MMRVSAPTSFENSWAMKRLNSIHCKAFRLRAFPNISIGNGDEVDLNAAGAADFCVERKLGVRRGARYSHTHYKTIHLGPPLASVLFANDNADRPPE